MKNIPEIIAIATLLAILSTGVVLISTTDILYWVDLIFDDSYYYLGIARNLAENHQSSFALPIQTNGFQPLWLLLLTITAKIFGTSHVSMSLQIFCMTVAFSMAFFILSKKIFGRGWPSVLATLAFPYVILCGMEAVMLPVFILLFFLRKKTTFEVG